MSPENWSGQCKDGLAEGTVTFGDFKGKAQFSSGYVNGLISFVRKDGFSYKCNYKDSLAYGGCSQKQGRYLNYTSRFEDGQELEGYGKKPFAVDAEPGKSSLEGEFYNGQLHGFGKFTISKSISTYALENKSNGQFTDKGKYLIAQGIWENGTLVKSCPSKKACQASESKQASKSRPSYLIACDKYYPGKVGTVKGGGFFATDDGYVVRYVNKDLGTVTIEGTEGGNSLKSGEVVEMYCNDDRMK